MPSLWGCSSVGRAPALQAGGQEFESLHLHDDKELTATAIKFDDTRECLHNRVWRQNLLKGCSANIRDERSVSVANPSGVIKKLVTSLYLENRILKMIK